MRKTVLIVGSESEIAQAIIRGLPADYRILTASRNAAAAADHFQVDLADEASVTSLLASLSGVPLDWIVYCAGYIRGVETIGTADPVELKQSRDVNCGSAVTIVNALASAIQPGGGVIGLSSTAGIWGSPSYPVYATWKGALNAFLQALHKAWANSGRYAFSLCPGPTNTKMRERIAGDAADHQSPDVVAQHVAQVLAAPEQFQPNAILVIRGGILSTLSQEAISTSGR